MIINLRPVQMDETLSVSKDGDVLTINGEQYDFSTLPEGATINEGSIPSQWIVSDVDRIDGKVVLTLLMPFSGLPPRHVTFPSPIIDPPDGEIILPTSEAFNVDA